MIGPEAIITYAQYDEDIILAALFHGVERGLYVDVGANFPKTDSVTLFFYKKGWHGVNIEPIKGLHSQLQKTRKRDVNLHCGLGEKEGISEFREYVDIPGHSTFDNRQKKEHPNDPHQDYQVQIKTLKQVFVENKLNHVHFIKIDVEGYEYEVVVGNDWVQFRPEVICIESNHVSKDWRPILLESDYKLFINDGLNEYYVRKESWGRTKGFAERVVLLDYHALKQHHYQQWLDDIKNIKKINQHIIRLEQENHTFKRKLHTIETLTLKNVPLRKRIKRAAYGLTIDWYKFKKNKP